MKMPDRHHLPYERRVYKGEEGCLDDLLGIDVVAFYSLPPWKCCRDSMFGFPPMVEQNLSENGNFAICSSLKIELRSEQR